MEGEVCVLIRLLCHCHPSFSFFHRKAGSLPLSFFPDHQRSTAIFDVYLQFLRVKMHAKTVLALLPLLAYSSPIRRQNNLQSFAGAIGGEAATPIEDSGNADRPFQVGEDTFVNIGAAVQRSCDQQFNR